MTTSLWDFLFLDLISKRQLQYLKFFKVQLDVQVRLHHQHHTVPSHRGCPPVPSLTQVTWLSKANKMRRSKHWTEPVQPEALSLINWWWWTEQVFIVNRWCGQESLLSKPAFHKPNRDISRQIHTGRIYYSWTLLTSK